MPSVEATMASHIHDADDCWDIVMGTELEPNELAVVVDEGGEAGAVVRTTPSSH